MYSITNISLIKKIEDCVWNVVFEMDNGPLQFTTDFLYSIKEKKWIFNSLITHELTSLMLGHDCLYCGENKIACFVSSTEYKKIKVAVIDHPEFRKLASEQLKININEIPLDYLVINDKKKWQELNDDNRFYLNIIRIQNKNN